MGCAVGNCVVWVDALCEVKSNEVLDFGCVLAVYG